MIRSFCYLIFVSLLSVAAAGAQTSQSPTQPPTSPQTHWPVQDGTYIIHNFRFGTGESIPELKLHYLTLG